ncbi:MAG: hypothetical protein RLZZ242_202 [Bacteroidota bacterium]|jgi:hypothetical protein
MRFSEKFYQETLSLCEITERVKFSEAHLKRPTALTAEITHQLIEDSILLKNSVYEALYDQTSEKHHFSLIRLAMILAKNLQSYLRGLEFDHAINREYLRRSRRSLRIYRRILLSNYNLWGAQLN